MVLLPDLSYSRLSLASGVHNSICGISYVSSNLKRQECVIDELHHRSVCRTENVLEEGGLCDRAKTATSSLTSLCDLRKWSVHAVGILTLGSMVILSL